MSVEHPLQLAIVSPPYSDGGVLGATGNHLIIKAHVQHTGRMAPQTPHDLERPHVPHQHGVVRRARDHDLVVVLETQHAGAVAGQGTQTGTLQIPAFDGPVAAAGDHFLRVKLDTVDAVLVAGEDLYLAVAVPPSPIELRLSLVQRAVVRGSDGR